MGMSHLYVIQARSVSHTHTHICNTLFFCSLQLSEWVGRINQARSLEACFCMRASHPMWNGINGLYILCANPLALFAVLGTFGFKTFLFALRSCRSIILQWGLNEHPAVQMLLGKPVNLVMREGQRRQLCLLLRDSGAALHAVLRIAPPWLFSSHNKS